MTTNNILLVKKDGRFLLEKTFQANAIYTLEKNQELEYIYIIFNNKLNIEVNLKDEASFAKIKVLYLANCSSEIDISVKMNHLFCNTTSVQEIKGIAKDAAQVTFQGGIFIENEAQHSDGYQNHRALLLSDTAKITSVPALEIYADDVKCTHGSATGPLDKEGLFYLMSRGISQKEAERILIQSFINDIVPPEYQYLTNEWIALNV